MWQSTETVFLERRDSLAEIAEVSIYLHSEIRQLLLVYLRDNVSCSLHAPANVRHEQKELLEKRLLKIQFYESLTSIVVAIVTMLLAVVTAILNWIK